jgi:DNA-binding transcriptional regulator YbjK
VTSTAPRSSRRFDPDRRDHIINATLDLIAEVGVAGVSHRKVAARAGVPLGSMTYHFASMDELLREAFGRFAASISVQFESRLAAAANADEARKAVADLVHVDVLGDARDLVLTLELYTLAARQPAFRQINQDWMAASRRALELHFDPNTARQLDALIEGLSIHRALAPQPHGRELTLEAINRLCAGA